MAWEDPSGNNDDTDGRPLKAPGITPYGAISRHSEIDHNKKGFPRETWATKSLPGSKDAVIVVDGYFMSPNKIVVKMLCDCGAQCRI
jgi:hypothetical protein